MKKSGIDTIASIDVGSNYLRMMIAQSMPDGETILLEDLRKPTDIGKDTFAYGRIGVQSIHATCEILKGFGQIMKEYKVNQYSAISTSGIREAENREYILEQIRLKTGLKVEIINNAQERFFMYKALRSYLPNFHESIEEGALIVNITSGAVEISVYSEGELKFTEYIKIGALRVREMLAGLEETTLDFQNVMEEFIKSKLFPIAEKVKGKELKNFIGLGGELSTILKLCNKDKARFLKKKHLNALYLKMKALSTEQIMNEYDVSRKQAEVIVPSIIILSCFLQMTNAEGIMAPMISLRQGVLADMVDEKLDTPGRKEALKDVISSVWYIGQKYGIDEAHSINIEKNAISIFDQTYKIHGLSSRERLYLQVAAILHTVGKYINLNQHDVHSYNIIRCQDIMGFSNAELNLIGNIAQYHLEAIPNHSHSNYKALTNEEKIIVSKLCAILKLAKSLDITHRQKIKEIEVTNLGEELQFKIVAKESIVLEQWFFSKNATFFEEVMGTRPILKCKG